MPDLTTPAGRDELRRRIEYDRFCHGRVRLDGIGLKDADLLSLLNQADAGEREWRPIAEAPRDGTDFLAALSNGWVVILSEVPGWDRFAWYRCSAQALSVPVARTHSELSSSVLLATHWQPLPPPPARAAAEIRNNENG